MKAGGFKSCRYMGIVEKLNKKESLDFKISKMKKVIFPEEVVFILLANTGV